jgi:hypothetical protein
MLSVMHLLTRRAFATRFEWGRILHLTVVIGGVAVAGELLLPTSGAVGFITRGAALLAIPAILWATGFAHREELDQTRALVVGALGSRGQR